MSHVHAPDGVLPVWLWATAWAATALLLALSGRFAGREPQRVAYQGALGALVLVAMALEIPIGPLDFHLTLIGPIGVLLGPAAAFQVLFVASAMLAFIGHGGFTVVGINALVLGIGAALARPIYRAVAGVRSPAVSLAASAACSHAISGACWLAVMALALGAREWADPHAHGVTRFGWLAGLAVPLWLAGVTIESVVAYGTGRFLARVRPDLLPAAAAARSPLSSAET